MTPTNPALPKGSWVYRNWHAQLDGKPEVFAEEIPLYTDARFTGEIRSGLGPYLILNTVPDPHDPGEVVPAAVLRISAHLTDDTAQVIEAFQLGIPDTQSFTGGSTSDEIAALLALSHRIRIAVGNPTRWFHAGDTDERGTPRHSSSPAPSIPLGRLPNVIPDLRRRVALSAEHLATYPNLPWDSARELARAARSYRQAVWVANDDGNLAWLLLVSAAETGANEWARQKHEPQLTSIELLQSLHPPYATQLAAAAAQHKQEVLKVVADAQLNVLRAQWKFLEFLIHFGLKPPEPRPIGGALDWTPDAMRKALKLVYKFRSDALHASTPFPLPMCEAPLQSDDGGGNIAWAEKPGGASFHMGGLWTSEQMPMNLYAFHHLVATALRQWWSAMVTES